MEELRHFIKSIVDIEDEDLECILLCFEEVSIKRDKYILKEKQTPTKYYFIKSGGVRIWFTKNEKPVTAWLLFENSFFSELASLKLAQPARFNIQAITDTCVYAIDKNSMERLYTQFPLWERFGQAYLGKRLFKSD